MTKRLRGWKLEMESGISKQAKASKALEKAEGAPESNLANKLLFLWARGQLSATLVRELADCAIQDGAVHEDLVAIAQTQPGNVHGQLMNQFCSNVKIAESFDVWVPCTHPKANKDVLEKASIFLPHMMFAALGQNCPEVFTQLFGFGKGTVADFWKEVAKSGDAKLKNHPCLWKRTGKLLPSPCLYMGME